MIPVRQGTRPGLDACIASIMEIPLHLVPSSRNMFRLQWWLADRGLMLLWVEDRAGYTIAEGRSLRQPAAIHNVVCKNGRMVFDPHPSDDGLAALTIHLRLVELSVAQMQQHARGEFWGKPNLSHQSETKRAA